MSEYRKAKPEEREACIEFADYVFSKAHCPHDFETLIPRVYGEGVDSASMHRIAVDERGKIRALIAVLREELEVGGKALQAGGQPSFLNRLISPSRLSIVSSSSVQVKPGLCRIVFSNSLFS